MFCFLRLLKWHFDNLSSQIFSRVNNIFELVLLSSWFTHSWVRIGSLRSSFRSSNKCTEIRSRASNPLINSFSSILSCSELNWRLKSNTCKRQMTEQIFAQKSFYKQWVCKKASIYEVSSWSYCILSGVSNIISSVTLRLDPEKTCDNSWVCINNLVYFAESIMVRCFFRLLINYSYSYSVVSVKRMKESTRVLLFFFVCHRRNLAPISTPSVVQ